MIKRPRSSQEKPEAVYYYGTCLADLLYSEAGMAGIRLLQGEGVRVIFPRHQTCCGQPAFNSGFQDEAREVAEQQIKQFPKNIPDRGSFRFLRGDDDTSLSWTFRWSSAA